MFKFTFIVSQSTLVAALFGEKYQGGDKIYIEVERVELQKMQRFGLVDSDYPGLAYLYDFPDVQYMPKLDFKKVGLPLPIPSLPDASENEGSAETFQQMGSCPFVTFKKDGERVHSVEPVTFYGKIVTKGLVFDDFKGKMIFSYEVRGLEKFTEGNKVYFFGTGDSKLSDLKAFDVHVVAAAIVPEGKGNETTRTRPRTLSSTSTASLSSEPGSDGIWEALKVASRKAFDVRRVTEEPVVADDATEGKGDETTRPRSLSSSSTVSLTDSLSTDREDIWTCYNRPSSSKNEEYCLVDRTPVELKEAKKANAKANANTYDTKIQLFRFKVGVSKAFEKINNEFSKAFSFWGSRDGEVDQQRLAKRFGFGRKITYYYKPWFCSPYRWWYGQWAPKIVTLPEYLI